MYPLLLWLHDLFTVSLVITSGTGYHAYRWFQSETCLSCKLDTIFELDFKEYMAQFHIGSVSNSRYFDSILYIS